MNNQILHSKIACNEKGTATKEYVKTQILSKPTDWVAWCLRVVFTKPAILKAFFVAVLISLQRLAGRRFAVTGWMMVVFLLLGNAAATARGKCTSICGIAGRSRSDSW
jgi:hypothetical protein